MLPYHSDLWLSANYCCCNWRNSAVHGQRALAGTGLLRLWLVIPLVTGFRVTSRSTWSLILRRYRKRTIKPGGICVCFVVGHSQIIHAAKREASAAKRAPSAQPLMLILRSLRKHTTCHFGVKDTQTHRQTRPEVSKLEEEKRPDLEKCIQMTDWNDRAWPTANKHFVLVGREGREGGGGVPWERDRPQITLAIYWLKRTGRGSEC